MPKPIEILAPAGDFAMLRAAVYSGADCVYIGVDGFNARRGAENFGGKALAEATAFCHARGCGVYAALNTLVFPGQQAQLEDAVRAVAEAGCDAIIVQDLATALTVQRLAPGLPLHGSTQMSVHSLAGVKQLAALGFTRVILSRELSEAEIACIAADSPVELEVFVHGALCVCVSGQCSMSAFLGGRSANRGGCAGPCRLPFKAQAMEAVPGMEGPGRERDGARQVNPQAAAPWQEGGQQQGAVQMGRPQDGKRSGRARPLPGSNAPAEKEHQLSLKDLSILDALPRLQAMGIVSAKIEGRLRGPDYCAVVVSAARAAREGKPYDKGLLQEVFSRSGFTDGWFTGENGAEMFGTRTAADSAAVKNATPAARELYRREMPRVPVKMNLITTPYGVQLTVWDGDGHHEHAEEAGPFAPAQKPGDEALRRALGKTGGTPFFVQDAQGDITIDAGGLFIPGPVVNELRRTALAGLLHLRGCPGRRTPLPTPLLDRVRACGHGPDREEQPRAAGIQGTAETGRPALRARFAHAGQIPGNHGLCQGLLLPLEQADRVPGELRGKTWLCLPRALFGDAEKRVADGVRRAAEMGFAGFEVQGMAQLALCEGLPVVGGFGLNVANADALAAYGALGCGLVTLSPELSLAGMAEIAAAQPGVATDALCYGHLPLMLTRAQPLANAAVARGGQQPGAPRRKACRPDALQHGPVQGALPQNGTLVDRRGYRFAVRAADGATSIYNPVPLWLGDRLADLPTATATLYFTQETAAQAGQVLQDYAAGRPAKGEFTRGLYDKPLAGR